MANGKATIREVYDLVESLRVDVTRVLDKHDDRILELERGQANAQGLGMGISFITALATSLAGVFFLKK